MRDEPVDRPEPSTERVTELLDGIPGAFERAQAAKRQAAAGESVPLDELDDPAVFNTTPDP